MPPQQRLWLDNEQGLFPGLNRLREKNQKHTVRLGIGRPFHLSPENNELLTQGCVFCHELGLASGKVCQRQEQEGGAVRFGPVDEAVVERPETKACQSRDEGENPLHSVHSPGEDERVNAYNCRLLLGNQQGGKDRMRGTHRPILTDGYHK